MGVLSGDRGTAFGVDGDGVDGDGVVSGTAVGGPVEEVMEAGFVGTVVSDVGWNSVSDSDEDEEDEEDEEDDEESRTG